MLRTIWTSLLGLLSYQTWIDPEDTQNPDSGHEMDPNG